MLHKPGHCALTGEQLADIKLQFPADHPLAGYPRQVGAFYPNAMRVTLLLMSGRQAKVTVAESCLGQVSAKLPELWRNLCEAFSFDEYVLPKYVRRGKDEKPEERRKTLLEVVNDRPLGVLAVERWADVAR